MIQQIGKVGQKNRTLIIILFILKQIKVKNLDKIKKYKVKAHFFGLVNT